MTLLLKKLREFKLSRQLIDVYRDDLKDVSLTGVVIDMTDEFVLLSLVSDDAGEFDGVQVIHRSDITRIRSDSRTLNSIVEINPEYLESLKVVNLDLSSLQGLLTSVQAEFGYVTIHNEQENACYIGQVMAQDDEWIDIKECGTKISRHSSQLLLSTEEVTAVSAGDKYEESIYQLAQSNGAQS